MSKNIVSDRVLNQFGQKVDSVSFEKNAPHIYSKYIHTQSFNKAPFHKMTEQHYHKANIFRTTCYTMLHIDIS